MINDNFGQNLNLLFSIREPGLRYSEDEVHYGVVIDDNNREISTIPIIEREERYLLPDESVGYTYLSLCVQGQKTETIRINSGDVFKSSTYVTSFCNQPFALFSRSSWEIFFKIIQVMLPEAEQRVVYQYSGWTGDLEGYLFGDLMVDCNNIRRVETTIVKTETLLSNKSEADVCKVVDDVAMHISVNPLVGYICFMYLMLSHCKQRFVRKFRLCPEFVLNIVGGTGTFKTYTTTGCYNTHDGSVSSFEDSMASIRRNFQSARSGVVIVDDYKISSAQNDATFEKIVRLSGDIQTTGKYVSGNHVVDELVTSMSVITGERKPQLQRSSYSRILFVDVEEFPISQQYLTVLQENKAEINSFVAQFVQFVLRDIDFDEDCKTSFENYRDELWHDEAFSGMHGRYYSMYAWMATIWDVYVKFLNSYGLQAEFDFKSEIKDYIRAQHELYSNDPIKMFKRGYLELVDSNEIIVTDKEGIESLEFDVAQFDGELFLRSGHAYKKICHYWKKRGIDFPVSEKKLRVLLDEVGILKRSSTNRRTSEKKTKSNRSYSGYTLLKSYFLRYGGAEDEN